MDGQGLPLSPDQVETLIRETSTRISKGVRICSERYEVFLAAEREYAKLYAEAYLEADGPAHEKRYAAEVRTTAARRIRDEADVKYRYADRQAKALELELRALQSVGASVRSMYSVAGRGES